MIDRWILIIAENPKLAALLTVVLCGCLAINFIYTAILLYDMGEIKRALRKKLPYERWGELD